MVGALEARHLRECRDDARGGRLHHRRPRHLPLVPGRSREGVFSVDFSSNSFTLSPSIGENGLESRFKVATSIPDSESGRRCPPRSYIVSWISCWGPLRGLLRLVPPAFRSPFGPRTAGYGHGDAPRQHRGSRFEAPCARKSCRGRQSPRGSPAGPRTRSSSKETRSSSKEMTGKKSEQSEPKAMETGQTLGMGVDDWLAARKRRVHLARFMKSMLASGQSAGPTSGGYKL